MVKLDLKSRAKKQSQNVLVSIVIVAYQSTSELLPCLQSVTDQVFDGSYEVIVVDNSPSSALKPLLSKKFPEITYTHPGENLGFGKGNNFGADSAVGEYLFFLNPDTELADNVVSELVAFFNSHPQAGVVAPLLATMEGKPYHQQGSRELNPVSLLGAHSWIHTYWPNNPVHRWYWFFNRDWQQPTQLSVVPGTALMIRRSVFSQIGGFDPRFFLYFEESDLCRRVINKGWEVWQTPTAVVRHHWGATTKHHQLDQVFRESRRYYFTKYYGAFTASVLEVFLELPRFIKGLVFREGD